MHCALSTTLYWVSTVDVRKIHRAAEKAHLDALIALLRQTVFALPTGFAGIERHLLPDRQLRRIAGDHFADHLMAQHHRLAHLKIADPAFLKVMQIRAADAAAVDFHQRSLPR